jgi:hypothetical protein
MSKCTQAESLQVTQHPYEKSLQVRELAHI